MNAARLHPSASSQALAELRASLAEAQDTLRAIRHGEVDAVVVDGNSGPRVFTLEGAEHAYRVLIESMNEGALTLTKDKTILYANRCFARMVNTPLENVLGASLKRFITAEDRLKLRAQLHRSLPAGAKLQLRLRVKGAAPVPVLISIRPLVQKKARQRVFGLVVTDMTTAQQTENLLHDLSQRVIHAQEVERGRVALELHDHITQLLCAIVIRSQVLVASLPASQPDARREAEKLTALLGSTAEEVERITRDLRPGALQIAGLGPVVRDTSRDFAERSGLAVSILCMRLGQRLAADTELTLFRVLQEALKNVQEHARARRVTVRLTRREALVRLAIKDDGVGFDLARSDAKRKPGKGLGLLDMRERVNYVGGKLSVVSAPGKGTAIEALVPFHRPGRRGGGGIFDPFPAGESLAQQRSA